MFECFLFAPVHDLESAAEIGNGAAIFKLRKVDIVMWPSLQSIGSGKLFIVHIYRLFRCVYLLPGMGSSRTVLELEDSSRTQNRGLGLGLGL